MYTFIVRPFGIKQGIDFDLVDKELIQPALRSSGILGETTMAIAEAGNIREDMFAKLLTADLVIADISVHNANVFYELGIRHALRDRKTLLLRCAADSILDVPFDLKTDRYLNYTLPTLKADSLRLKQALQETIHSDRKDSPVFSLLPHLKAQDPERFVVAPAGFSGQVAEAQLNRHEGKLALLAAETEGFPWELSGLRLVGTIQFDMGSMTGARLTWERIRAILPDDEEANDRLSTIYQRLSEEYTVHSQELNSPSLTLLSLSDQAINTLLSYPELSPNKRAEAYSLKGRNARFRWMNEWQFAQPDEYRQKAIESSFLLRAYEAYAHAFVEDLNHYNSGISALGLLTIILNLAEENTQLWEEHFDNPQEADMALQVLQRKYTELVTVVGASIESARHRKYSHGEVNNLLDLNLADLRCLTLDKPRRILRLYQDAISSGDPVQVEYTRHQLELYKKLQIRLDVVEPVLKHLAPVDDGPTVSLKPHFVVFTGHMIDRPNHGYRFPTDQAEKAKDEIRKKLNAIRKRIKRPVIGIAGGSCGGDILFHEVCEEAEMDIATRMFLAVPRQQHIKESVAFAGQNWVDRFDQLYQNHNQPDDCRIRLLSDSKKQPFWLQRKKNYTLWERTNLWMIYHALVYGGNEVTLLALWDGKGGGGLGSMEDLVHRMDAHGAEIVIIKTTELFKSPGRSVPAEISRDEVGSFDQ